MNAGRCVVADRVCQHVGHRPPEDQLVRDLLVVERADLLERVRERVVSDVVQQCSGLDDGSLVRRDAPELAALPEQRERPSCQMIRADGVLEPRVRRAGVDEVREPELPDVPQPLEGGCVDEAKRNVIDADVVPERVADGRRGR